MTVVSGLFLAIGGMYPDEFGKADLRRLLTSLLQDFSSAMTAASSLQLLDSQLLLNTSEHLMLQPPVALCLGLLVAQSLAQHLSRG